MNQGLVSTERSNIAASRLIDCDAPPRQKRKIFRHCKGGQLEFDPAMVELFLSDRQQGTKRVNGHELLREFEEKPVMNSCVLDHLLENQSLIPENWKQDDLGRPLDIFFWGTIYRCQDVYLLVRYLHWGLGGIDRWSDGWRWIGFPFGDLSPAAILKKR